MNYLKKGNIEFENGNFKSAMNFYSKLIKNNHNLKEIALFNFELCKLRLKNEIKANENNENNENNEKLVSSGSEKDTRIKKYKDNKKNRKAKVVVFTAITGGYDKLITPEHIVDEWDYVLFTDGHIKDESIFEVREIPFTDDDPVRIARYVKLNPNSLFGDEYEYALWIDGNILLRQGIRDEVEYHINKGIDIVFRKHPDRNSPYEEIKKCQELLKDDFGLMSRQLKKYENSNYSPKSPLFETNVILRKLKKSTTDKFNSKWWSELKEGSRRDQLSVNFSLDSCEINWGLFNETHDIRNIKNKNYYLFTHNGVKDKRKTELPKVFFTELVYKNSNKSKSFVYDHETIESANIPFKYKKFLIKGRELGYFEKAKISILNEIEKEKDLGRKSYAYFVLLMLNLLKGDYDKEEISNIFSFLEKNTKDKKLIRDVSFLKGEIYGVEQESFNGYKSFDSLFQISNKRNQLEYTQKVLNYIFSYYGLGLIRTNSMENIDHPLFDSIFPSKPTHRKDIVESNYRVSVIVSCFNVESSIETCLNSLINQSWRNLEIICIDDRSEDNTVEIIEHYASFDKRIKLLKNNLNKGTYENRNFSIKQASGQFVTVADADDWHHPDKIKYQVEHLLNNENIVANVASWVRLDNNLIFNRRNALHYKHLNISSLMFKKEEVLKALGKWDTVRFAADGEFYKRLKRIFDNRVSELPAITSLGRYESGSLTNNTTTGYYGFPFGARKEYLEAYEFHHENATNDELNYSINIARYPVPPSMKSRDNQPEKLKKLFVSDLREYKNAHYAIDFIYEALRSGISFGICHVPSFEGDPRGRVHKDLRRVLNGIGKSCLVYGDSIEVSSTIFYGSDISIIDYPFLPNIKTKKIKIVQTNENISLDDHSIKEIFSNPSIVRVKDTQDLLCKSNDEDREFYTSLYIIDVKEIDSFIYKGSNKITIIMPCIDLELGKKTAEILLRRAGIDCTVVIAFDSKRQGFIRTLNSVAEKTYSRYVCYVAQDAYPGRDWLNIAYQNIFSHEKGLLAFNDGKWHGRIASFGMVDREWISGHYGSSILHESYKAHKADNEITVLAKLDDKYVYCAESVLLEVDYNKDSGGSNLDDDRTFKDRFNSGFNGAFLKSSVEPLRKLYKVKA